MSGVDWTEKLIARFRALHAGGKRSFQQIADKLSGEFRIKLTKNACIGKGRRLGLEQRPRSTPSPSPGPRKPRTPRRAKTQTDEVAQETVPVLPHWGIEAPDAAIGNRLTIYGLKEGVCHYPYGERPPYAYCGNTTRRGVSWCPHHEHVVYPGGRLR